MTEELRKYSTIKNTIFTFFSITVSLATGSICIALISKFHQNEAVLIIITCATFLYAMTCLYSLVVRLPSNSMSDKAINIMGTFFQIMTLCCAIEYFNFSIKHKIISSSKLHTNLLITFDSLLLFTLFFNGIIIGNKMESPSQQNYTTASSNTINKQDEKFIENDKFIPMKDSTQTLTPAMDMFFPKNFNMETSPDPRSLWTDNVLGQGGKASVDNNSTGSVIRHTLGPIIVPSQGSINGLHNKSEIKKNHHHHNLFKLRGLGIISPTLKNKNMRNNNNNHSQNLQEEGEGVPKNTKYITRLSTISDISKSLLNVLGTPNQSLEGTAKQERPTSKQQSLERPFSIMIDNSHLKTLSEVRSAAISPALEQEKIAIGRINNALLPPCLRLEHNNNSNNRLPSSITEEQISQITRPVSPLIPEIPTLASTNEAVNGTVKIEGVNGNFVHEEVEFENVVLALDQQAIPNLDFNDNFHSNSIEHIELPNKVTMEMWEKNKNQFLQRATSLQQQLLLSPFQMDPNTNTMNLAISSEELQSSDAYSFPRKPSIVNNAQLKQQEIVNDDAISELDEYLNEFEINELNESQIMEDSLKQPITNTYPNEQFQTNNYTTDNSRQHSPTKSIMSIISGGGNTNHSLHHHQNHHRKQNSITNFLTGNSHTRTPSQMTYMHSNSNSNPPSPTRSQILKRIGKKLSLSNISDSMLPHSFSNESPSSPIPGNNELFNFHTYGGFHQDQHQYHNRGKSLDFSYLHSLQNSPMKQTSGMSRSGSTYQNRRNSLKPSKSLAPPLPVNSNFYKQKNNITYSFTNNNSNVELESPSLILRRTSSNPDSHRSSLVSSKDSGTEYPDIVMSQYDRERWNTITNLHLNEPRIDNE
ncbi:Irc8p NDAI_0G05840 [Naumovozyma dairenensis CBS 421]|uniref:Uncharacterized protein n=1 Tax=Naumovozyma dairenensis (strain ATCC 10597 / BCRC 20456 / CBS 421 / NBRC 0211 / NRRL Y-12639) TaxID=1071378 RepID=J7RTK1_NAUDC|nr:hypothetical protein NDAI_0G05840 [Naumovozyma dairenensis CBS 421]CCK73567.1 hypothetical protein NDAI_0G05840 [Naumovozyma dairenensis CBS 421]